jgi:hypothetical protein
MSTSITRRRVLGMTALLGVAGCKRVLGQGDETRTVFGTKDKLGKLRALSVPKSWTEDIEKNPAAEIVAGNRDDDVFVMVLSEPRTDFPNYTLDRYGELTRSSVARNLSGGKVSAKVAVTVQGRAGVEAEIRGGFRDGTSLPDGGAHVANLVYLHTSVELERSYCQVVGWTSADRWDEKSALLRKVTASFHEEG